MPINPPWAPQSVPFWPAGYQADTELFNNLGQQTLGWLANRFMFRATRNAAQGIVSNTNTLITYDTILEDPYSGWQTLQPAGWTVPFTGWYEITTTSTNTGAAVFLATGANISGLYNFFSADILTSASFAGGSHGTYTVQLNGGTDYVSGFIYSGNGGSTTGSTNGFRCSIEILYLSQ